MQWNNVLIFSDLHIGDYHNYNKFKESRLFQSRILTNLIIKAGIKYNCDRFIIAGDVIDIPIMKNNVLNEVKMMLNKLCSHYKNDNYIIYGQHDLSTKEIDQDPRFSGLTAILPSNLYYADKIQWNLCGRRVAMMNWKPVQDLSWINGVVDLFVGHVTLAPPGAQYKGQSIDQSKFNLSITGDIHKHFSLGKSVSIGSCQQNKLGDQLESTAIVWNPNDNSWMKIDLDPNRELLQLKYTNDRKKEGFNETGNCYYVYRPVRMSNSSGSNSINIPKWEEVSSLAEEIINANNLSVVHNEVLKNLGNQDSSIDFNFTPLKLRLVNFRSIEFAEIYFDDMDKISIQGDNGAGKSSLILGLYNSLRENRSLKDFVRFGADSCECEIEFIYQGTNNKILRGTKTYGCWINGEKIPYNNKREFEDDMYRRYPFLSYTDVYFFNADRSSILGSMAPERKSEVISKLFRIDRIDLYNSVAKSILNSIYSSIESKVNELSNTNAVIESLKSQISIINIPNSSLDELKSIQSSLLNDQKRYNEYMEFKSRIERLNGKKDSELDRISNIKSKLLGIDINKVNSEISFHESEINELNRKHLDYLNLVRSKESIDRSINEINSKGSKVYSDLQKVKSNVCPTCGSHVHLGEIEASLTEEMNNLLLERSRLSKELDFINNSMNLNGLTEDKFISEMNKHKPELDSLREVQFEYRSMSSQVSELEGSVSLIDTEIKSQESNKEFPIKSLPEGFYDKLNSVNSDIHVLESYINLSNELSALVSKFDKESKEVEEVKSTASLVDRYVKLTSSTGDIYREVMNKISKDFSDDVIRYEVNQYKFRGKDHLDLDVQYNVAGRWVSYQSLSSGQKTIADINFLSRILVECGLLVFDETLKHLSQSSTEYCLDIMKGMNVHTIILTSHMYGVESFSNKCINLNLDDSGLTKINLL